MSGPLRRGHWSGNLRNPEREHGFEPVPVEGALPAGLRGTLYRNGPMGFERFGRRIGHLFDGDGGLVALRIQDGRAEAAQRIARTPEFLEEERAGRFLYAGFAAPGRGLRRLRFKNVANTHVLPWQGRLLALWEAGLPTEIDRERLEFVGRTDLGGAIRGPFSAHPHRVPARRATYNFGVRMGRRAVLDLYELPDTGPARRIATVPLARPTMVHDFAVTDSHLIVLVPPLGIRLAGFLSGLRPLGRSFVWRPEWGTEVILVPIDRPDEVVRWRTEPFWVWHFANAFEREGRIVADFCRIPDFGHFEDFGAFTRGERGFGDAGRLDRAEIDPAGRRVRFEPLWDVGCDFPRVAPAVEAGPHRAVYVACASTPRVAETRWFDAVARVDVETGKADVYAVEGEQVVSEPIFVPNPAGTDEMDGWVFAAVYDPDRDETASTIFDAGNLAAGPIARCRYGQRVPFRFHGAWVPG